MKYTHILWILLAISSCTYFQGEGSQTIDSLKTDSIKIDTTKVDTPEVDSRTEVLDTLKKKTASIHYTIKCVAYRS
jgi:hypothetical protein